MVGDPYFPFQKQILFRIISILSKNEQKNQYAKLKNISVESCRLAVMLFKEPHQFTK